MATKPGCYGLRVYPVLANLLWSMRWKSSFIDVVAGLLYLMAIMFAMGYLRTLALAIRTAAKTYGVFAKRRSGEAAKLMMEVGVIVVSAFISPF
jgi:hypothetical protein